MNSCSDTVFIDRGDLVGVTMKLVCEIPLPHSCLSRVYLIDNLSSFLLIQIFSEFTSRLSFKGNFLERLIFSSVVKWVNSRLYLI